MPDLNKIEWEEGAVLRLPSLDLSLKGKSAEVHFMSAEARGIGIDPGRKLGIGIVQNNTLSAWFYELPQDNTPEAAMEFGETLVRAFPKMPVILEAAAPSKHFYQVPLAEIRFGLKHGMEKGGATVQVIRPNSIRLQALGKGTARATDAWPPLTEHAADAAAAALVAAGWRFK